LPFGSFCFELLVRTIVAQQRVTTMRPISLFHNVGFLGSLVLYPPQKFELPLF
jgi:hypothetical protein